MRMVDGVLFDFSFLSVLLRLILRILLCLSRLLGVLLRLVFRILLSRFGIVKQYQPRRKPWTGGCVICLRRDDFLQDSLLMCTHMLATATWPAVTVVCDQTRS